MANVTYGKYVFGLNDLKVTNIGGTTQEDLDVGMELTFTPEFKSGKLDGDDSRKAIVSFLIGGQAKVTAGSLSTAAIGIITGKTVSTTGTTPNQVTELQIDAGDRMPYFKLYGRVRDEGDGDAHVLLKKVKLVKGLELALKDGEWVTPGFEMECIDDGTNGVFELKQNETSGTLPTS